MSISDNIKSIKQEIALASAIRQAKGLEASPVRLVAVTKNQTTASIEEAIGAGIDCIGENRIQEALSKKSVIQRPVEWHLIGHLQTNKTRQAVASFDLIHSVDSERLAVELDKEAARIGKKQAVLLQVNMAGEETKFGVTEAGTFPLAKTIASLANLELAGLMTIAPYFDDAELARPVFREMYQLFKCLRTEADINTNFKWLSMGMTNDYKIAIEEGANLVRIGTAIFGPRQY